MNRAADVSNRFTSNAMSLIGRARNTWPFSYRAAHTGWYFVEVKVATPGSGAYQLKLVKSPPSSL